MAVAPNGFTLFELLIVLVILAGLVAIALPQFSQLYARVRFSFERSDIERQLLELPQTVRQRGRGGVLKEVAAAASLPERSADGARQDVVPQDWEPLQIELPPGWSIHMPKEIYYRFSGACSGGVVEVSAPAAVTLAYTLTPPLCRPILAPANGG